MSELNSPESMRKRAELLDELKALQATLRLEQRLDPSKIPLLDEVIDEAIDTDVEEALNSASVTTAGEAAPAEEAAAPGPEQPLAAAPASQPYRDSDNFDREIFLQEVIDAMMPEIEAELRRRMLALDEEILYRWYQQHLGDN